MIAANFIHGNFSFLGRLITDTSIFLIIRCRFGLGFLFLRRRSFCPCPILSAADEVCPVFAKISTYHGYSGQPPWRLIRRGDYLLLALLDQSFAVVNHADPEKTQRDNHQ